MAKQHVELIVNNPEDLTKLRQLEVYAAEYHHYALQVQTHEFGRELTDDEEVRVDTLHDEIKTISRELNSKYYVDMDLVINENLWEHWELLDKHSGTTLEARIKEEAARRRRRKNVPKKTKEKAEELGIW